MRFVLNLMQLPRDNAPICIKELTVKKFAYSNFPISLIAAGLADQNEDHGMDGPKCASYM